MNHGEGLDIKGNTKKLYPNLSARNLFKKETLPHEIIPGVPKQVRARITDHTDDRNSERSQSHYAQHEAYNRIGEEASQIYAGDSRMSNRGAYAGETGLRVLSQKEQKMIELRERLKNIHHFYRIRIEEERNKNIERNQIFIGIIQELQRNHTDKIAAARKNLDDIEEEKQDLGYVDQRMLNIKNTVEQILMQSKELSSANQAIEKQLTRKETGLKEKQAHYREIKEQSRVLREKLQQFERLKLKENKRNKELLEMIEHNPR